MRLGRSIVITALVLAGLVLSACGSASAPDRAVSAGSPGSSSNDEQSLVAIVQCFRTNGDPGFPDPVYDAGDGRWHFAISPASAPASARQACQHLFPAATPAPPVSQAAFRQLVAFAQCMRRHGVFDWPDPAPDGVFHLDARLIALGKDGEVGRAIRACPFPAGGIQIADGA